MKKIEQILMLLAFLMAQAVFVSCSDDDDNGSTGSNNELVTIDKNGNASNGGVFSAIDDQNFYLDYIKYTVEKGHLVVTGYDEAGFKGVAKIVARIAYNGNTYEVLEIGESAFDECSKLTSVIIPNTVTSIGKYAFCECEELTSLTIPNSVKSIAYYAFAYCEGLTSLTIPSSVTSIDFGFCYCSGLTSIKVEEGNKNYDSRNNCNAIIETATNRLITGCSKTVIPNSVTIIGNSSFEYCYGLTSITIPNSVTDIEEFAFYSCDGLTSITIPNSVTYIGGYAFGYCDELASVHCLGLTPPDADVDAFNSTYQTATLYVPKGSLAAYKSEYVWSRFKNIVEE